MKPVQLAFSYQSNTDTGNITTGETEGSSGPFAWRLKPAGDGFELSLRLTQKVVLGYAQIMFELPFNTNQVTVLPNGYQSWTGTFPIAFDTEPRKLRKLANVFKIKAYGDYFFWPPAGTPLPLRENTWSSHGCLGLLVGDNSYIRLEQTEGEHFAIFSPNDGKICLTIDCAGHAAEAGNDLLLSTIRISEHTTAGGIIPGTATRTSSLDLPAKAAGWTSWYHYYTDISGDIISQNLKAFQAAGVKIDYFQIDDGFQTKVGDWLSLKDGFEGKMAGITGSIHQAGYQAGLWLAPFVAERKSNIVKNHRDWLKRTTAGKLVKCGWNPMWSGTFYALDLNHPEVLDYLDQVFDTVLNEWDFDLVKLDFLYAAALDPLPGKSRGESMRRGMQLLRKWVGKKKILGCGVPIESSIDYVDFNRIGSDVALKWEDKALKWLGYRERVSTINSLQATISRFQYDGQAFRNDPDVFILRDEKQKMSWLERVTLFTINQTLGSVLFTSDYIGDYTSQQMKLYKSALPLFDFTDKSIQAAGDLVRIFTGAGANRFQVVANLGSETTRTGIASAGFSGPFLIKDPANGKLELVGTDAEVVLEGRQTKIICQLNRVGQCATDGHLFPGLDIKSLNLIDGDIDLEAANRFDKAYVVLPAGSDGSVQINGQTSRLVTKDGLNYALFG